MRRKRTFRWVPVLVATMAWGWGCDRQQMKEPPATTPTAPDSKPGPQENPPAPQVPCKDPSPGPIIVLTPTDGGGNKFQATWTFDEDDSPVPQGTDDAISIRFVGLVYGTDGFQLKKKDDATILNPNKVEIVIKSGQERTLRIRREVILSAHYFEWRFGSGTLAPLNVCDDVGDNCIQDCTNRLQTLPSKVFGEIVSIRVDDVDLAPANLDWLRLRADVQHPCP